MTRNTSKNNGKAKINIRQEATELLDWIIDFLPAATPPSLEAAVLDESGEVHALFWHRSELQQILEKEPNALSEDQRRKLVEFDKKIKESALLFLGAEKGTLQRYRQGRYDHSHWWWYLDDVLQEELRAKRLAKQGVRYGAVSGDKRSLPKVADQQIAYGRKSKVGRK
jgi:hypothetical protein